MKKILFTITVLAVNLSHAIVVDGVVSEQDYLSIQKIIDTEEDELGKLSLFFNKYPQSTAFNLTLKGYLYYQKSNLNALKNELVLFKQNNKIKNTWSELVLAYYYLLTDTSKVEYYLKSSLSLDKDRLNPYAAIIGEKFIQENNINNNGFSGMLVHYKEKSLSSLFMLGLHEFYIQNYDQAIAYYNMLQGKLNKTSYYNALGDVYISKNDLIKAKQYFTSSYSIKPTFDAYLGLGYIAQCSKDKKTAESMYSKAVDLVKNGSQYKKAVAAYQLLSDIALDKNDISTARMWTRKAIEIEDDYENNLTWARLTVLDGDWENAYAQLDYMFQTFGDSRDIRILQIVCNALQEKEDETSILITSFIAKYPKDKIWFKNELAKWDISI